MSRVDVGGATLQLLPQKAVWWPAQRTLLVADAHIGKAVSFRRLGVPVPRGTTGASLHLLAELIDRHGAARVVFLGDLLHSARAHAAGTMQAFARWREQHAKLDLVLPEAAREAVESGLTLRLTYEVTVNRVRRYMPDAGVAARLTTGAIETLGTA